MEKVRLWQRHIMPKKPKKQKTIRNSLKIKKKEKYKCHQKAAFQVRSTLTHPNYKELEYEKRGCSCS